MSKRKKPETPESYQINRKIRRGWGEIKPYTRIIPDKRNKPPKHKRKDNEE